MSDIVITQSALFGLAHPVTPRAPLSLRETVEYRVAANSAAVSLRELLIALFGQEPLAERVLAKYGTATAIAHASTRELMAIPGLTERRARQLRVAVEFGKRVATDQLPERKSIHCPADSADVLRPLLADQEQEYLYVLLLDTRNRVLGTPVEIYHGSLNTSLIRVGEIFKEAIRANAAALILAHNHPSGDPSPSPEDVAVTRAVREAGKLLDIDVLDHLVIGHQRFVSLKERGLGF